MRLGCSSSTDYPVIFAQRSTLWQHMDELLHHLAIDPSTVPDTERQPFTGVQSRPNLLTPMELAHLIAVYAPLSAFFLALGPFLVLNQTSCATPHIAALMAELAPQT